MTADIKMKQTNNNLIVNEQNVVVVVVLYMQLYSSYDSRHKDETS